MLNDCCVLETVIWYKRVVCLHNFCENWTLPCSTCYIFPGCLRRLTLNNLSYDLDYYHDEKMSNDAYERMGSDVNDCDGLLCGHNTCRGKGMCRVTSANCKLLVLRDVVYNKLISLNPPKYFDEELFQRSRTTCFNFRTSRMICMLTLYFDLLFAYEA